MPRYVLSIDQGTTSSTVMVLDEETRVLAKASREVEQIYPRPGWVEHSPAAIWASVTTALRDALRQARIDPAHIAAVGITNQRETSLIWDRGTGQPAYNAIVWQDRRTTDLCDQLKADGLLPLFRERTGLVLDPYFSGTKVRWLLDNVDHARAQADAGKLAFGTVDSYLIWRLTGGKVHVTEVSNASRTLLFDLRTLAWDPELLAALKVPASLLPEVRSSSEVLGTTCGVPGLPDGIPVAGCAGDQQAALFGQACFAPGDAKCTYGTGAFLLVNTGDEVVRSQNGLITTVAWRIGGKTAYALEGSAFIAGAAVQWLRDGLGIIGRASEIESLASQVSDSAGVVFVPALVGLGAPHWRPAARGTIMGITRGTTAAHLARATLEGVALQIHDLVQAVCADRGQPLCSFKVDGGAAANNLLMQFQADILEVEIVRPVVVETTALGAAFLAGLATGVWESSAAIAASWRQERQFSPRMTPEDRAAHLTRWARAVGVA
jgi:glycerol kinase